MRNKIDIQELSFITTAIADYSNVLDKITQLDPEQGVTLREFYDQWLDKHDVKYINSAMIDEWDCVDLHYFQQMWGSTSGGWGGMGGSAMTTTYTLVIENRFIGIIAVYYGGQLAYIAKMDDKLETYQAKRYRNLPGISDAKKVLNLIYYKRR